MEMDVPLPDELELLEESYCFHEEDDFESFPYEEDEAHPSKPDSPRPGASPPSPETTIDGLKRPRISGDADEASGKKRGRIDADDVVEEDEEWLRYSPEKVSDPVVEEERRGGDSVDEKFVWRFASEIDGDFFPVTAPSGGDRAYTRLSRATEAEARRKKPNTWSGGLIEEPINVLLHKAEQEAFAKALQASSGDPGDLVLNETSVVHEQLWVDKYSPNSFTELLSDEQTNREVLHWLKQWDSCVFGSELTSTSTEVLSALRRHSTISQHQKSSSLNYLGRNKGARWNKENFRNNSDFDYKSKHFDKEDGHSKGVQDSWNKKPRPVGPPEQKILLLCGPPGLGKTTLAHVAARHCGYRVVEINASDDRSAATVEAKILDVVQMNSVTMDSRPKCLVIDEIDGSLGEGKGAVDVILKMVSADLKSDTGKENVDKEGNSQKSTKKGRKSQPLLRPVICICNDLYAPVLRPLRNIAKVHVFVQPTVSRVVSRLKYICNKEGMKPNSMGLSTLAQYTECDIRSCLNTLQFLHKKKEALNVLEVSSQVVGRKDMSKSVFDIWKAVFQKKKSIRERRSDISTTNATPSEFESLHSLISSRGDYDLIMDGIHENFLQLSYHDPVMQKTVKCLNNLGISDFLHQYAFRTQHMQLLAYQPGLAVGVHRQVVQVQRPNIEWPKNYQRYRTMLIEKKYSLRSWNNIIQPHISRHLSTSSFVEDSVSLLLHILSPPTLRPVALNSLLEKEKNELEELIMKMVSYSITYKNVRLNPFAREPRNEAASESFTLAFDPPINDLVTFKGYSSGHYVLALPMKQVLVHEVEKQRILLVSTGRSGGHLTDKCDKENQSVLVRETGREKPNKPLEKVHETKTGHYNPSTSAASCNAGPVGNSGAETAKPKSFGAAQRSLNDRFDFFDRFRKLSKNPQNTAKATRNDDTSERDLRPVLFKFNEGFTNAVKRPVRMREFLQ